MITIEKENLVKNTEKIKSKLKVVKDKTLTTDKISVLFPELYINKDLAKIDSYVESLCVLLLMDEYNNYAPVMASVKVIFYPDRINKVMLDNEVYFKLEFEKGTPLFTNNYAICTMNFIYNLFDLFYLLGKVPWFVTYEMLSGLLNKTSKYNGNNIGNDSLILELLTAIITRVKNEEDVYYKNKINTRSDLNKFVPEYKGLNDVYFSLSTTSSKMIGGYLEDGIINAIINPSEDLTPIEKILKE